MSEAAYGDGLSRGNGSIVRKLVVTAGMYRRINMDGDETKVYCGDCNSYLWSDFDPSGRDVVIIRCPCKLDPVGKCTGIYKDRTGGSK